MAKPTEWIKDNYMKYSSQAELIDACVEATGSAKYTCKKLFYRLRLRNEIPPMSKRVEFAVAGPPKIGLSESELRAKHDLSFIIKKAADQLQKGSFLVESEFIRTNLRGMSGYRQYMDDPEFGMFKGRAGGVTYWAHPESIQKMKNEGILN
jgi:hypothetical protein